MGKILWWRIRFWSHDKKSRKIRKIFIPKYNRAIFFDTTQNSCMDLLIR